MGASNSKERKRRDMILTKLLCRRGSHRTNLDAGTPEQTQSAKKVKTGKSVTIVSPQTSPTALSPRLKRPTYFTGYDSEYTGSSESEKPSTFDLKDKMNCSFHGKVVHIETANTTRENPYGKSIESFYDGIHDGELLGTGVSGIVRECVHKKTGVKYAVKCLSLEFVETEEQMEKLKTEIYIMGQLDHPNIVRLEEVYESPETIYLVQELCTGGDLFERLEEQSDYHYGEAECARLVKQMLNAVKYLHTKGIIHRDLKLENFLFSSKNTDSDLKLIDFGLSKHFTKGEVHSEAVGTPYTVAPEVIVGQHDERCDLWSIGVIAFLLLSGDPPFGGCGGPEPNYTIRDNILQCKYSFEPEYIWNSISYNAKHFIQSMLVTDPDKRIRSAGIAQKHPWLEEWAEKSWDEGDKIVNPHVVQSLMQFKEYGDMRKLLCEVLSFTLLPDQINELKKEFEKIDQDGNGEITFENLKTVLMTGANAGSLGALTEEEVQEVFNAMRIQKTETTIHWHEFIAASLSLCQVDDRNIRLAFDRMDSDHKGYISLENILHLLGDMTEQEKESTRQMYEDGLRKCCEHKGKSCSMKSDMGMNYDDFMLLMKGQIQKQVLEEIPPSLQHDDSKISEETTKDLGDSGRSIRSAIQSAIMENAQPHSSPRPYHTVARRFDAPPSPVSYQLSQSIYHRDRADNSNNFRQLVLPVLNRDVVLSSAGERHTAGLVLRNGETQELPKLWKDISRKARRYGHRRNVSDISGMKLTGEDRGNSYRHRRIRMRSSLDSLLEEPKALLRGLGKLSSDNDKI